MRRYFFLFLIFISVQCYSQTPLGVQFSGVIVTPDTLPIPDVAVVNIHTGKTVRTNSMGYFQAQVEPGDSLMIYHISYKKRFISLNNHPGYIILYPEVQEISQIDINDNRAREQRNLQQTVRDIIRLAPMKPLAGYEVHSRQDYFVLEHGSHTKGFSPFFGPTARIPLEDVTSRVVGTKDRRELKQLTSHYHLAKKNKHDKEN